MFRLVSVMRSLVTRAFDRIFTSIVLWFVSRRDDGVLGVSLYKQGERVRSWSMPSCPFLDFVLGRKRLFADGGVNLKWLFSRQQHTTTAYHIRRNGKETKVYSGEVFHNVSDIMNACGFVDGEKNKKSTAVIEVVMKDKTKDCCLDVTDAVAFGWMDKTLPNIMDVLHIAMDIGKLKTWDIPNVHIVRVVGFMGSSFVERTFDVHETSPLTGVEVPRITRQAKKSVL